MLEVLDGVAVHAVHDAGRFRASPDDAGVDRPLDDLDPLAGPAKHVPRAGPHAVEADLARTHAVHGPVRAHVDAGRVRIEREHGEAGPVARPAPGAGAHRDDVRRGGVEDDALGSAESVAVTVRLGTRLDVGELVARLALGEGERELQLPCREPGEPVALRGPAPLQQVRAHHHRREVRLDRERRPEPFHHDRGLHRPAADAAGVFRDAEPQPPELRELGPEIAAEPGLARRERAPDLERVLRVDELVDALAQELLFVGEGEVHGA